MMPETVASPETPRLQLRQWRDEDYAPFAAMSADPRVMQYFPSTLSREESDALASRYRALLEDRGWGLWAVQTKDDPRFIGFVGLHIPSAELPFSPCVEISWRLAFDEWRKGYAFEAAATALHHGFTTLALKEIVAFTTEGNQRSRALMHRLGMQHDLSENFLHPQLPEKHPLRTHVLYRLKAVRGSAR